MPGPLTYTYKEINTNGTFELKAAQGHLHRIVVNVPGSGTLQVFDNTTAAAPAIAGATAFALPAAGSVLNYDCDFYTALTVVVASMTAGSITVVFA